MAALPGIRPRTVHVEHCMGTVFSIDIRDPGPWDEAITQVTAFLHRADALFSTYRPGSELMRVRRAELALADAHPSLAEVLGLARQLEQETGGYFSTSWGGSLDPTGLVKGWAVERASGLLRACGSRNHSVNGGGDVQLAGEAGPGQPWRVGISSPFDRSRVLAVVAGRDLAVATSGTAERGAHIINPVAGRPAAGLASVTVTGRALGRVDAYATAAFAMGPGALGWLESRPGCAGLLVYPDGTMASTSGLGQGGQPRHRP